MSRAVSSGSKVFANSAFVVFGALRVNSTAIIHYSPKFSDPQQRGQSRTILVVIFSYF